MSDISGRRWERRAGRKILRKQCSSEKACCEAQAQAEMFFFSLYLALLVH
jgi:hypothetical protein